MSEISNETPRPEHLDYWNRNDRLYKTLLSFGLWVEPVYAESPIKGDIMYLRVSVGQPQFDELKHNSGAALN